jgi:hypothetical protein
VQLVVDNIQWIMLIVGVLTLTMLQGVFAPKAAIRSYFDEDLSSPALTIVVRNWSFLIVLTAVFLLYAAFIEPAWRVPALILSGAGKLCFVVLVFAAGGRYAKRRAFTAAILDGVFIAVFALYLFTVAAS